MACLEGLHYSAGNDIHPHAHVPFLLCRPNPEPFESPLGFLLRVSGSNSFDSLSWLTSLLFAHPRPIPRKLAAMPTGMVAKLARRLLKPSEQLQPHFYSFERSHKASSENESGFRFRGHKLDSAHMRFHTAKVCPSCLADRGCASDFWDLAFYTSCHVHKTLMVEKCFTCNQRLTWNRKCVHKCQCGADLREMRPDKRSALHTLAIVSFLHGHLKTFPDLEINSLNELLYCLNVVASLNYSLPAIFIAQYAISKMPLDTLDDSISGAYSLLNSGLSLRSILTSPLCDIPRFRGDEKLVESAAFGKLFELKKLLGNYEALNSRLSSCLRTQEQKIPLCDDQAEERRRTRREGLLLRVARNGFVTTNDATRFLCFSEAKLASLVQNNKLNSRSAAGLSRETNLSFAVENILTIRDAIRHSLGTDTVSFITSQSPHALKEGVRSGDLAVVDEVSTSKRLHFDLRIIGSKFLNLPRPSKHQTRLFSTFHKHKVPNDGSDFISKGDVCRLLGLNEIALSRLLHMGFLHASRDNLKSNLYSKDDALSLVDWRRRFPNHLTAEETAWVLGLTVQAFERQMVRDGKICVAVRGAFDLFSQTEVSALFTAIHPPAPISADVAARFDIHPVQAKALIRKFAGDRLKIFDQLK